MMGWKSRAREFMNSIFDTVVLDILQLAEKKDAVAAAAAAVAAAAGINM